MHFPRKDIVAKNFLFSKQKWTKMVNEWENFWKMHSAVKVEKRKKERKKKCVTSTNDFLIKILLRQ
jgi:hypothetical protein